MMIKNEKSLRLVFAGGHHTPAIAVIRQLHASRDTLHAPPEIFWFGHKFSMQGAAEPGAEYRTITGVGITFYDLKAGKVYRTRDPLMWLRIPFGFLQALFLLLKTRPNLIVSFGGYLAVPVVVAGWVLGIPSVTHEQTVVSGWANRVIAKFAKKVFITWEESGKFFPKEKVVVTGLPLRKEIFSARQLGSEAAWQFLLHQIGCPTAQLPNCQTVYITGGKQGSQTINRAVEEVLPELLKHFNVIHQTGGQQSAVSNQQSAINQGIYLAKDYFGEDEIGAVYAAADFVVSRAGANTVYELAALGKPAILIPIPWVSHNEQESNAQILTKAGSGVILPQSELNSERLVRECKEMGEHLEEFNQGGKRAQKLVNLDGADRIAEEILALLKG